MIRLDGAAMAAAAAAAAAAMCASAAMAQGAGTETVQYPQGGAGGSGYASASVDFEWRAIACFGEIHIAYGLLPGSLRHSQEYWLEGEDSPVAVEARVQDLSTVSIEGTAYRSPAREFETFRDGIAGQTLGFDCFSGQTKRVGMVRDFLTDPTPQQIQEFLSTIDVSITATGPLRSSAAESEIRAARQREEREREQAERAEEERLAEQERMRELRQQAEETAAQQEEERRLAEEAAAREARAGGDEQLLSELERLDAIRNRARGGGGGTETADAGAAGGGAGAEDPTGTLIVTAPEDGSVSDANVVWVEGYADLSAAPAGQAAQLSLSVNGQSQLVSMDSGGGFRTAAVLGSGENELTLTLESPGGRAQLTRRVTYSGEGSGLRVTLTWDGAADIDLYVTSPGGYEVSYQNDFSDGMTLDVDNTDAYGPENVTVPDAVPGTYSFAADNYSGTYGVTARIDVFVDERLQTSHEYTFPGGRERWNAGSVTIGAPAPAAAGAARGGGTYEPSVGGLQEEAEAAEAMTSDDDPSICTSGLTLGTNPNCASGNSASLVNSCSRPVDANICIMTTRGDWDCGVIYGVQPGQSASYPACFGTDRTFSAVRYSDSNQPLARPD